MPTPEQPREQSTDQVDTSLEPFHIPSAEEIQQHILEEQKRQEQEAAEHAGEIANAEQNLTQQDTATSPETSSTATDTQGEHESPTQENREGQQTDPSKDEFKISMLWKEPSKFFDHVMVKGAVWFRQAATWLRDSGSPFWASVLEWISNTDVAILFAKLQESAYDLGDAMGDPEKRKPYIDKLKQIYGKIAHLPQYAKEKFNKDTFYSLVVNGLEGPQQSWGNILASAEKLFAAEQEKAKNMPPAGTPAAPAAPAAGTSANPAATPGTTGTPSTGTPQ